MKEHVKDSLDHYLIQAKKCITKYGNVINPDDDFVSFVAYYMMLADWRFDPDKGVRKGTFRLSYAKGAIKMYFRSKKSFANSMPQLDNYREGDTTEGTRHITPYIADYDMAPEHKEKIDIIFQEMRTLDPRERYVLTQVLLNDRRYSSLSRELSISKQGVRNIYDKALHKTKMRVDAALSS